MWLIGSALYFHDSTLERSLKIAYPSIQLHAIARKNEVDGQMIPASLYCQLDTLCITLEDGTEMKIGGEADEQESDDCLEIRFIPSDEALGTLSLSEDATCLTDSSGRHVPTSVRVFSLASSRF